MDANANEISRETVCCGRPNSLARTGSNSRLKLLLCMPDADVYESLHEQQSCTNAPDMGIYATIAFPRCVTLTPKHTFNQRALPDVPSADRASLYDDIEPYGELTLQLAGNCNTCDRNVARSHSSSSVSSGRFTATGSPCSPELADDITLPPCKVSSAVYSSVRRLGGPTVVDIAIDGDDSSKNKPPPLPRRTYRDEELNALFVELVHKDARTNQQAVPLAWFTTERIYESISNLNLDNDDQHLQLRCIDDVQRTQSSESSGHCESSSLSSDSELERRSSVASDCRSEQSDKLTALNCNLLCVNNSANPCSTKRCLLLEELDKLRFIDSDGEFASFPFQLRMLLINFYRY